MYLKYLVTFALGLGAGYFLSTKLLEKKYADIAQEEIDAMKDYYKDKKIESSVEVKEEVTIVAVPGVPVPSYKSQPSSLERTKTSDYNKIKQKYSLVRPRMSVQTEDKEAFSFKEEIPEVTEYEEPEDLTDSTDLPYIIDDERFYNEFDHHDKITLIYYRVDDVLCDENEEIIDDIERTVGYDVLNLLDTQTNAWIRNEKINTDYEIVAVNRSYTQEVYGIIKQESPRETYLKNLKKKEMNEDD